MPIYEFYCPSCHVVYSFLSRTSGVPRQPACPRCARPELERRVSRFAISRGRPEPGEAEDMPDLDDSRLERAMSELASEAESLNESDPKAMARLMRRLFRETGMPLGEGMEEAIRRMEAGEDPDRIDEEMGDLLEQETPFAEGEGGGEGQRLRRAVRRRLRPPAVDDTLYELDPGPLRDS
jgi:putative FmdB family regulatory protein